MECAALRDEKALSEAKLEALAAEAAAAKATAAALEARVAGLAESASDAAKMLHMGRMRFSVDGEWVGALLVPCVTGAIQL